MPRYVVVREGQVRAISSVEITSSVDVVMEVPAELDGVPSNVLMNAYALRDGKLVKVGSTKPASETRLALVGNWKMRCGISTYSEKLWPEVVKHVADWRIFAERNDSPTGPANVVGGVEVDPSRILPCWKRGEALHELVASLREWKPDVVWIQHEYGLWPNARYWLSLLSQLSDVRVIVTLHSVYHHMDKLVAEAAIPEIIVHQDEARDVLCEAKHVPGVVHVVAHGCDMNVDTTRLWNIYKSERTFMQFGFGFRYKGWENSIRAVAILKQTYPDVFFTGLFSESPFSATEHEAYVQDLKKLIAELGVEDNVAIVRGYQSDQSLDSYLRTNRAVVFPYVSHPLHEVYGASGAARVAMSRGVPVVTTTVRHFVDIPTIKASDPEEIAAALSGVFKDHKTWRAQVAKQNEYVEANSWSNVGARIAKILGED
jgi:glycosyltransferase involved in cell wall biosynthesis